MAKMKYVIACSIVLLLVLVTTSLGQTSKGFIVGTITDPNTAAVPGVTIKITNTATGVTRETITQEDGSYRFDAVDPGTYRIDITATGFKSATREVVVAAAQTSEVSFPLEVGNPAEIVTVTSGTSGVELQNQDGARVNTIGTRQITELPVQGLNPVNLVFTLPGVVDPGPLGGGFVQGTEFSVNGLRPRANNQLIDGLDNNDNSITGQFYQPVLRDGYNEVTVLHSDYSAEFGRAGGAVVNLITRSGTNEFHGSVYDVITPSKLAALSPFEKAGSGLTKKPVTIENNYGFSLGGPILKNKLFFFSTIQWSPLRAGGVSSTPVVPTAEGVAQLRALFPAGTSPNLDRYLAAIGDLRGATGVFGVPLGGETAIPFGTATRTSSQPVDDTQYLFRVDWTPNNNNSVSVRYLADDQIFSNQVPTFSSLQFPGTEVDVPSLIQNAYINWTRTFSPNTTNEFRFGYGRFNVLFNYRNEDLLSAPPQFNFGGTASSLTSIGPDPTFPQGRIFNNYQFQDTISHTMGDHTFRAGFDVMVQRAKQFIPINTRGTFTFTDSVDEEGTVLVPALRNFLENFSGNSGAFAAKVFGENVDYPDVVNQAYFINDTWRVRPNLSLNLGLRYERYGVAANAARFPAFCGFDVPFPTRCEVERDTNNFAPRFSFAYTPNWGQWLFGKDATVIRGGFAVNYDVYFNNILSNTVATSPNAIGITTFGTDAPDPVRGFADASNTLPTDAPEATATATQSTVLPNLHNPKTYVWNFGIQRQLPWNVVADVAYVGSRGLHLFINEELNPRNILAAGRPRVHPGFGPVQPRTNGGDSNYHSLQTRLERGFANRLLFRAAYTFSKAIDNVNSEVFVTSGGSSRASDLLGNLGGRRLDRSVASYDVPHAASVSVLYDIPSASDNRFVRGITSGFTISGIWRIQSGAVETAYLNGFDINFDGVATNDRPAISNPNAPRNSVAIANALCDVDSPTGYCTNDFVTPVALNDARFLVDPNIRTGIVGRNTLRAPMWNRLDLSLTKAIGMPFTPWEGDKFAIRVDFFNVLNRPIFTWDANTEGGFSDGDIFNTFFNQPQLNGGPNDTLRTSRSGRIQLRYSF
ncbi:MAG TPA: carboxypeptidase regulatory-like domain-containing protein [Pyrinomonadaceae bacterium]|nr:carboxypeptidase regulatory-like domain-containing protein [Pyrinomonadaceae bacterium]